MKDKKIDILGTEYSINFYKSLQPPKEGEWMYGECDSSIQKISIATHDREGRPLNDNIIKTTLLHEVMHAILNEGQYLAASGDEPMVEWIARCIYSMIKQKII